MPLFKAIGDRAGEATTLNNIGRVYDALGEKQKALDYYAQSLPLSKAVGDRTGEARVLGNIGNVYNALGEKQKALDYYAQALPLSKAVGDRAGEAVTLYSIAYTYRAQGKLEQALAQINAAISIIEDLRTKIGSQDLRTSYFSTVQDRYEFKTNLLMQLHQKHPEKSYDQQALETADRSLARSLIELLTEAGVDLKTTTANSPFITQENQLKQSLFQLEQQRVVLLNSNSNRTPAQIEELSKKVEELDKKSDTLIAQLQDLANRLRATNPAYAAIKYPQPLTTDQIQQQVLDKDTVLLQYALGEKQSYLWLVTPNSIKSYILPDINSIEASAKTFYDLTRDPNSPISQIKLTGDALFKIVLAPVAEQLKGKRLLIVGDGILRTIPFEALPLPNNTAYVPLLKDHEMINAPSASSITVLRQQRYPIGSKTIAVFADPVFKSTDGRITGRENPNLDVCTQATNSDKDTAPLNPTLPIELQLNLRDVGLQSYKRLPGTRIEAEKILALVPATQRSAACAFAANHDRVTQPKTDPLNQYRIIHFATHGFINDERPQLSGLLLSLFTPQGKPRNGFLRLRDIFDLKLGADLVVLSACQTGLGKNVRGEGLVGLTRGFMYAGSKRVVTSLWKVEDAATAELMSLFYQKVLKEKQTPSAALRAAQLQMWQTNPDHPSQWAAFTLQGEWRP